MTRTLSFPRYAPVTWHKPVAAHMQRRQAGFTLVELMVGLTIGLLVAIAAMGSLIFTQISSKSVGDSTRMQQDAATIFRIAGFHLREAGAVRIIAATPGTENVVFTASFNGFGTTGFAITGTEGAAGAPDVLNISHDIAPELDARDCLGNAPAAGAVRIDNSFAVNNQAELTCTGTSALVGAQPIALGVEDFQVTYGVRTGGSVQFFSANGILSWDSVESVRICLQMSGETAGNPNPTVAIVGCNGAAAAADGRIRRVFRNTFNLRNLQS